MSQEPSQKHLLKKMAQWRMDRLDNILRCFYQRPNNNLGSNNNSVYNTDQQSISATKWSLHIKINKVNKLCRTVGSTIRNSWNQDYGSSEQPKSEQFTKILQCLLLIRIIDLLYDPKKGRLKKDNFWGGIKSDPIFIYSFLGFYQ